MRPVLRESSAAKGRERAAELARGRRNPNRRGPEPTVDLNPRRCRCVVPWNDGEGDCQYCGKSIEGQR